MSTIPCGCEDVCRGHGQPTYPRADKCGACGAHLGWVMSEAAEDFALGWCEACEEGVLMVIALQKFAGIEEPREKAESGWRRMSASEREVTRRAHAMVCAQGGTT